jgi:hypothetical protein
LRRRIAVTAAALMLLLGACGDDGDYPPEVIENFMDGCTAQPGATESYCRCSIDRIQNDVRFDEFKELEEGLTDQSEFPDRLVEAIRECVDEAQ